jgi:hypothetical protein
MPKPRQRRRRLSPREAAPLPAERIAEQPFLWWPQAARLVCPWERHVLWPDESAKLAKVVEQVDVFGAALRVPCWLWPDARPPVPVRADDPHFLRRYSEDRASLVRG